MIDVIANMVLTLGSSMVATVVAKATLVLGVAVVFALTATRVRASVRHLVLVCACGMLLILPAATILLAPWRIEVPAPHRGVAATTEARASTAPVRLVDGDVAATIRPAQRTTLDASAGLVAIWIAGVLICCVPAGSGFLCVRHLRRHARPILALQQLARDIAVTGGLRREVDVAVHDDISVPMTVGVLRPLILLPAQVDEWSDAHQRQALVHELEHVRRRDVLSGMLGEFVRAVYWFHPLAWMVRRQLRLEAERACDDAVLVRADGPDYADQLLALAGIGRVPPRFPALPMSSQSDLAVRVRSILSAHGRRGPVRLRLVVAAGIAAAGVTLTLAPLRAVPALAAAPLQAPTPAVAGAGPAFAVASIKKNDDPNGPRAFSAPAPGRVRLINQTVRQLISSAYQVQDYQIVGGPEWLRRERYDIEATADGAAAAPQMLLMVRTLLADRFGLVMRSERREMPIFQLTYARSDRKRGPKLKASECRPPETGQPITAGTCGNQVGTGIMSLRGNTARGLATQLGRMPLVGRPVVDVTGLTDMLDIELSWAAETVVDPAAAAANPELVSIFTALQEQLGLKLEPARGPVDVLLIDRAEFPTAN